MVLSGGMVLGERWEMGQTNGSSGEMAEISGLSGLSVAEAWLVGTAAASG